MHKIRSWSSDTGDAEGVMPENTIEGFREAIKRGVDGIEWDVVVNNQGQLVISHEPYFHKDFCFDTQGNPIEDETRYNIYRMSQMQIKGFDCGTKFHKGFPEQQKIKASKPLLKEVMNMVPEIRSKRIFLKLNRMNPNTVYRNLSPKTMLLSYSMR